MKIVFSKTSQPNPEYTDCISAQEWYPFIECPDMTLNHLMAGDLGNVEYAFIAIAPGPTDRVLYMGQIERTACKKNDWC